MENLKLPFDPGWMNAAERLAGTAPRYDPNAGFHWRLPPKKACLKRAVTVHINFCFKKRREVCFPDRFMTMQKFFKTSTGSRVIWAVGLLLAASVHADVTYTLHFTPSNSAEEQQVANSVAEAVSVINEYGSFNKHWNVYYNAGIPTA